VLGVGMTADDELARVAGVLTNGGIVVDDLLRTSDARISAIGDCAVAIWPDTGETQRLESIPSAQAQARRVAERLVGGAPSPLPAPRSWSHQGELNLQFVGRLGPVDHRVQTGDDSAFSILGFRGDQLSNVESVNDPGRHMAARRIFDQRLPVTRSMCGTHEFD